MNVCVPNVCQMSAEVRGCWISWNWSYRHLQATMFELGIKPESSARAPSTLNFWAISSASCLKIFSSVLSPVDVLCVWLFSPACVYVHHIEALIHDFWIYATDRTLQPHDHQPALKWSYYIRQTSINQKCSTRIQAKIISITDKILCMWDTKQISVIMKPVTLYANCVFMW